MRWLRRNPFLALGLVTLALSMYVAHISPPEREHLGILLPILRVLIIPMYIGWLLMAMAGVAVFGGGAHPSPVVAVLWEIVRGAVGLAPYVLADYALRRWRERTPIPE